MIADSSIDDLVYYEEDIKQHLQKIAERFSEVGDCWFPSFLVDGEIKVFPHDGEYLNVPLFIEVGRYGIQESYNREEGFVTHSKGANTQRFYIPVGSCDVKTESYSDWETQEWGTKVKIYNWKYK